MNNTRMDRSDAIKTGPAPTVAQPSVPAHLQVLVKDPKSRGSEFSSHLNSRSPQNLLV
jgi:hypothetical protein